MKLSRLLLLSALLASAGAHAGLLQFEFTPDDPEASSAFWSLDANQTPSSSYAGIGFIVSDVDVVYKAPPPRKLSLAFFVTANNMGGGFALYCTTDCLPGEEGIELINGLGEQLFTGDVTSPQFRIGEFQITGFNARDLSGVLRVSEAFVPTLSVLRTTEAPAPAPLALLAFALAGMAIARRPLR